MKKSLLFLNLLYSRSDCVMQTAVLQERQFLPNCSCHFNWAGSVALLNPQITLFSGDIAITFDNNFNIY